MNKINKIDKKISLTVLPSSISALYLEVAFQSSMASLNFITGLIIGITVVNLLLIYNFYIETR
jgi:uncharacterized membrane protein